MKDLNINSTSIKNWALDDRPREKMAAKGHESLSNAELLAILINTGSQERSALDIAQELLLKCNNNLYELHKWSIEDLQKTKGIGLAKAITIKAALELGKRRHLEHYIEKMSLGNHEDTAKFFKTLLQNNEVECFLALYVNRRLKYISHEILSEGGLSFTAVDPQIILKKALLCNAHGFIVCHNHPSGSLEPSIADIKLTERLAQIGTIMGIKLIDHFIVSEAGYYSFVRDGKL